MELLGHPLEAEDPARVRLVPGVEVLGEAEDPSRPDRRDGGQGRIGGEPGGDCGRGLAVGDHEDGLGIPCGDLLEPDLGPARAGVRALPDSGSASAFREDGLHPGGGRQLVAAGGAGLQDEDSRPLGGGERVDLRGHGGEGGTVIVDDRCGSARIAEGLAEGGDVLEVVLGGLEVEVELLDAKGVERGAEALAHRALQHDEIGPLGRVGLGAGGPVEGGLRGEARIDRGEEGAEALVDPGYRDDSVLGLGEGIGRVGDHDDGLAAEYDPGRQGRGRREEDCGQQHRGEWLSFHEARLLSR